MSDTTPHLILHKVRGEPAFDVAQKLLVNEEVWWIIPTSGHRAYPFRYWSLEDLSDISDINSYGYHSRPLNSIDQLPSDWRDHYEATDELHRFSEKTSARRRAVLRDLGVTDEEITEAIKLIRGIK